MKRFMTGEWKVRVCGVLLAVTMGSRNDRLWQ